MRADAWSLAKNGHIQMVDPAAPLGDPLGGEGEKAVGACAPPASVARREMHPDVAIRDGAEKGVCQSVENDIAIGMGGHAFRRRNPYASEPQVIARREGMDIKACS